MSRFLQAEIDLRALINNFHFIKSIVKDANPKNKIIAIVKADAYGHGVIEVSRTLEHLKVDYLGVAFYDEAVFLREAGINCPILLLFDREVEGVFKYNLTPVIFDIKYAEELSNYAKRKNLMLSIHVKVETGMGRLGLYENICEQIKKIANMPNLKLEGVMSHLSVAEDYDWSLQQINKLTELKNCLKTININPLFHIANSAGLFFNKALFDAVRPGLILYGYATNRSLQGITPCMTVKTKILDIRRLPKNTPISYGKTFITKRDSLIGVIPIGYADGYFRRLSNRGFMIVRGKKAPVVGIVCMDITMIDLTEIQEAKIGDEVIILGSSGEEKITAWDIADWSDTIAYEVLTSLGSKAKRKYIY
ncbi:MAG: alanine racemase [Thermodesulfovibrio sp.]|nr:alanine racemase [Thermodesulfovibrio sp.]